MKKYITIGMSVLKIVICGGKSSVLWSQSSFYGDEKADKSDFEHMFVEM